jgi:hypothetical protein
MRILRTLMAAVILVACGTTPSARDAGTHDAGAPSAGAPAIARERSTVARIVMPQGTRRLPTRPSAGTKRLSSAKPPDPRVTRCIDKHYSEWEELVACIQAPPSKPDAGARLFGDFVPAPSVNPAWLIPAWYLATTGNDKNTCVDAGHPCRTWHRILDRIGTTEPTLSNDVAIFILDSQTDDTDRIVFNPYMQEGSESYFQCQWSSVATGTLTVNQAKSTTDPDGRLKLTLSGGASTVLATDPTGLFVVNGTRSSSLAPVLDLVSGSTVWMGQPFAPNVPVPPALPNGFPAEDDTWATGDSYTLFRLANVFISEYRPRTIESRSVSGENRYVFGSATHCRIPDLAVSGQIGNTTLLTNNGVAWVEDWIDAANIHPEDDTVGDFQMANTAGVGGIISNFTNIIGGAMGDPRSQLTSTLSQANLDGDLSIRGVVFLGGHYNTIGGVQVANHSIEILSNALGSSPASQMYGTYLFSVGAIGPSGNVAAFGYGGATAGDFFKGVPSFQVDGLSVGIARDTAHSLAPEIPDVSITVANIDATVASGGFGGYAFGYGGSVIEPETPTSPGSPSPFFVAGTDIALTGCNTPGSSCTIASTATGAVTSVTGAGTVNCTPTTGAVTCTGTNAVSSVSGTSGVSCSPTTGAVSCSNTGVTSLAAGTGISLSGSTGAVTVTNTVALPTLTNHDLVVGQGTTTPTFLAPGSGGNFARSNGTDWFSSTLPAWFYSQGSGTAASPCNSSTFAAITITVPSTGAIVDLTATLTAVSPGVVCTLTWGVSVDNTACSFSVSTGVSTDANTGNLFGSALTYENSYSAGSHTFDIQAGAGGGSGCSTISINDAHLDIVAH